MTRAPVVNQGVVLPPPGEKYDVANEREMRRLLEETLRRLMQWGAVTDVPTPVVALGVLTGAADMVPYFSGVSAMALAALTPYARTILACADAPTTRAVLGLGPIALLSTITESNVTLADNATLNVSSTEHGLTPKSPADATKFLNGAATPAFVQVKGSDLLLSDVATNDVSTVRHGFAPKAPGDATKFLNGTGGYTTPSSSGIFPPALPTFPTLTGKLLRLSAEPTISTLTLNTDALLATITDATGAWGGNFTAATTARPRWVDRAINNLRPGLVFDGVASKLTCAISKIVPQPFCVIAVVQNWRLGAVNANLFRTEDGTNGPVLFISGGNSWAIYAGGTTLSSTALFNQNRQAVPAYMGVGAPAIIMSTFNGASSLISNNGVEVTGAVGTTGFTGTLRVGADGSTSSFAGCVYYEILILDHAPNSTERAAINTYYSQALNIQL